MEFGGVGPGSNSSGGGGGIVTEVVVDLHMSLFFGVPAGFHSSSGGGHGMSVSTLAALAVFHPVRLSLSPARNAVMYS